MNVDFDVRVKGTLAVLEEEIEENDVILEIGSYGGSFQRFINRDFHKWVTVDNAGDPDYLCDVGVPGMRLPFDDNSIDKIICTQVLEHLVCGSPLMREFSRVLKSTGGCYISVPNIVSLTARLKWLFGKVPAMAASGDCGNPLGGTGRLVDGEWVAAHVVDFNHSRLVKYLDRSGLEVVKSYKLPNRIKGITFPAGLLPVTLASFLFVKSVKKT